MQYINGTGLSLETDGVTVIDNVISPDELLTLRGMMWDYLHHITKKCTKPIVENVTDTYKTFFKLHPLHGMMLHNWEFGHNPMSWYIRQHPNIIKTFGTIWNTSKLLTSFDGLSVSLPCEHTGLGWYDNRTWFHADQSYKDSEFKCVQGFVNLYDVNNGDATLRVLRGSHRYHQECGEQFNIEKESDWNLLNKNQLKFYLKNCDDICISAKAGSLVLWDSRTIHQGMEPQKDRIEPNIRCALYVCMTPKEWSDKSDLAKKRKAFLEKRTTSHNPNSIVLFPFQPGRNKTLPPLIPLRIKESILMRTLAGFN